MTLEFPETRWEWEQRFRESRLGGVTSGRPGRRVSGAAVMAVGFALASYGDADGRNVRPTTETVARGTGLSHSTVKRALDRLRGMGWLTVVRPGGVGRATEYRLSVGYEALVPIKR